jgi:hypothetical protein
MIKGNGLPALAGDAPETGLGVSEPVAGYRTYVESVRKGVARAFPCAGVLRLWSTRVSVSKPTR